MAATFAIVLADTLMGKLGETAPQEARNKASLLLNFKYEFKFLKKNLRKILLHLQAAHEQSEQNEDVKKWLTEVRNIAFYAHDIIDECAAQHLYTDFSQSFLNFCVQLVFRCKMEKRIKNLKHRMSSTIQEAQELKLLHNESHISQPSTSTSPSERRGQFRRWSILEEDLPTVVIDHKAEEILRLLENPAAAVVAIAGICGLGKTFLLQHVYNRSKHRYECSAWISVSQTCSLKKLQCELASHIGLEIENTVSDLRAAELIYCKLEGQSCLIVLDDVWSSFVEGNLMFRLGFPTGRDSQCKIVLTTRDKDVAVNMKAHIYEMQQLSEVESWDLFCLYAFPDREGNTPPQQLESLAHQIMEECGRLPLAVKIVAASMTNSSLTSDWESKLGQLKTVGKGEDSIKKILKLTYDSLPPYLKLCFAYFSFFPKDTYISFSASKNDKAIHQDYVLYMWIAEGFIPHENAQVQCDNGLNYLLQLENLCFLDVNRVLSCYSVHDLLLDLVVNISKEQECEFDLPSQETSCRRLLLANKGIDTNDISEKPLNCQQLLRTLSFFENPGITSIPQHLLNNVRFLRVIDFSRTAISTLPKSVGKLKLLKVLNLSHTEIKEVPKCVRKLKSLQFLNISYCRSLRCVPDWIGELKCLSYLNVEWCSNELVNNYMPKGMSQLLNLRTLKSDCFPLSTEENGFFTVEDVGSLTNLQEISFKLRDVRGLRTVEDGIFDHLINMTNLAVMNATLEESTSNLPAFPAKMNVMKDLQLLYLRRFSVPSWICGMQNLRELLLENCSDYSSLEKMPNLKKMILKDDSKCRELPKNFGESGAFPKLVKMEIRGFPLLEDFPALEEEAMQCLQELWIENCPLVKKAPEGMERLKRLNMIKVIQTSGEERSKESKEDWKKIKAKNPRMEVVFR